MVLVFYDKAKLVFSKSFNQKAKLLVRGVLVALTVFYFRTSRPRSLIKLFFKKKTTLKQHLLLMLIKLAIFHRVSSSFKCMFLVT